MATDPTYFSTPVIWSGLTPATLDTSLTAPTHVTTLGSAGANGTKITRIDLLAVGTTVAGDVNLFLFDGTNYWLFESVVEAVFTSNTTSGANKVTYYYDDVILPSGWSLRATTTVAGDQSVVCINAYGASA